MASPAAACYCTLAVTKEKSGGSGPKVCYWPSQNPDFAVNALQISTMSPQLDTKLLKLIKVTQAASDIKTLKKTVGNPRNQT